MHPPRFERTTRWITALLFTIWLATLLAACGGRDDPVVPIPQPAPTITSVTATPISLPVSGGTVLLTWVSTDASTLTLDNGIGDVIGSTSKSVNVITNTTFTLTASNPTGTLTRSTAVTLATLAAPSIASFTATRASLPSGGGAVTLNWTTTDAATLAIDNGVGVVTGTSAVVNVAANTTFTLIATNPSGAVNKTASVSVAAVSPNTRFIDAANGADTNPCTQAAPRKTLVNAMLGAPSGANTFLLADGVYSPDTEGVGGINTPHGAILQAIHPGAATLASLAVNVVGMATLDGLVVGRKDANSGCGGIEAGSSFGIQTLTLTGVFSNCTNWPSTGGKVKATMTPGTLPGGAHTSGLPTGATRWARVNGAAELLIVGGVLDGHGSGNAYPQAALLEANRSGKLILDGVIVRNWQQAALYAAGGSVNFGANVTLRNGTLTNSVGKAGAACLTGSAILVGWGGGSLTMVHAPLSNAPAAVICVQNNFDASVKSSLQLTQSNITRSGGAAIQSESTQGIGAVITADGVALTDNAYGIYWTGCTGTSEDLRNCTVSGSAVNSTTGLGGIGVFISFAEASSLKLRDSRLTDNTQYGMQIDGNLNADFGTAAAPGGNTLTGNGLAGPRSAAATGQFVDAVGNIWIASQQGADANGRYSTPPLYTSVLKVGPASGTNFKIDNATALNL